jgi:hypothetical protein
LPGNDRGIPIQTQTDGREGFMKYAVEMGSGAMIYIPSFIKIGSGTQQLIGGIHRQHGDIISLFLFFQNKESSLKYTKSSVFFYCKRLI